MDFQQSWEKLGIKPKTKILVAVSTGVDSMVLLDCLQKLPKNLAVRVSVAFCNHQLRDQTIIEENYITNYCHARRIPLYKTTWNLENRYLSGMEQAAREWRYNFFEKVMLEHDIHYLATAHHADDQAETFLMKVIRGGDISSLLGIKRKRTFRKSGYLIRPLLDFSKKEILLYARTNEIRFFEDETNFEDDVQRNRIRHHVIPILKQENSQLLNHIEHFQDQLQDILDISQQLIALKIQDLLIDDKYYNLSTFKQYSKAIQKQVLRRLLQQKILDVSERQIVICLKILYNHNSQTQYQLNGEFTFYKEYDVFYISKITEDKKNIPFMEELTFNGKISLPDCDVYLLNSKKYQPQENDDIYVFDELPMRLYIRHRLPGDYIQNSWGKQKVKKILIDKKIPNSKRNHLYVLASEKNKVYKIINVKQSDLSATLINDKIQYIVLVRQHMEE